MTFVKEMTVEGRDLGSNLNGNEYQNCFEIWL